MTIDVKTLIPDGWLFRRNGANIDGQDPALLGGGATSVIARTVLGSPTATIDFTSIAGTYETLMVDIMGRGDTAATNTGVLVRLNNDSGSNYQASGYGGASSLFFNNAVAQTSVRVGAMSAATAPTNYASSSRVVIPSYARTTFFKAFVTDSEFAIGNGAGEQFREVDGGLWLSTAAINRVTLLPAAGNFDTGTVATIYGVKGA